MEKPPRTASHSLNRALSFLSRILTEKQIPILMIAEEKLLVPVRRHLTKSDNSSPLLGDIGETERKSRVNVYKFAGTIKGEFSDIKKARQFAASLAEKYPGVLFDPYTERRSGRDRRSRNDRRSGTDRRRA